MQKLCTSRSLPCYVPFSCTGIRRISPCECLVRVHYSESCVPRKIAVPYFHGRSTFFSIINSKFRSSKYGSFRFILEGYDVFPCTESNVLKCVTREFVDEIYRALDPYFRRKSPSFSRLWSNGIFLH